MKKTNKTTLVVINPKGKAERLLGKVQTEQDRPKVEKAETVEKLACLLAASKRYLDVSSEASEKTSQALSLERQARELKRSAKRHHKRANFILKTAFIRMSIWGISGFIMGAAVAVQEVLEKHGPTVTTKGTVEATIIYLIVGAFFGSLFGGLSLAWSKQRIREHAKAAAALKAEEKSLREQANTYMIESADLNDRSVKAFNEFKQQ